MDYKFNLFLRLIASFLIVFLGEKVFYPILFWPLFYSAYFLLFPYSPKIFQNSLIINDKKLVFVSACIAISAYILLSILILLTKEISLKKGIKVFLTGVLALFLANLIRVYVLAIILLEFNIKLFNTLHLFFWDILSTVFVFLLWVALVKYFKIKAIPIYSDFNYLRKL